MLIPYSTDAPLYHYPITTIAVMVVNFLVFGWSAQNPEAAAQYCLWYGDGLHPIQWITSNFLHANFMHLFGNLIGMWVFGMIVEGKLGWWRTLAVMMSIGIGECAVEQTLALGMSEGASLGASSMIYGLMAMCLVWAPMNNVSCIFIFFVKFFQFEIAVLYLVGIYLAFQIGGMALLNDTLMSTEFLHLLGAVVGAVVSIVMLQAKMVDCEGWDVFSVLTNKREVLLGESKGDVDEKVKVREEEEKYRQEQQAHLDQRQTAMEQIRQLIASRQPLVALQLHQKMLAQSHDWNLSQNDLLQLIGVLQQQRMWRESVPVMIELLRKYPANSDPVRVKLAHVLIEAERRPAQALRVLSKLNPALMEPTLAQQVQQLETHAKAMLPQFPHEIADQDW